MLMILNKFQ